MKCSNESKRKSVLKFKKLTAILLSLIIIVMLCGCGESFVWNEIVLSSKLPQPVSESGEIHTNSTESLSLDVMNISSKDFADYIEACKDKGYTIEAKSDSISYFAFSEEGYKLNLDYNESDEEMGIMLDAPIEMSDITWPTSKAGKLLPKPKSSIGKFNYEHEDNFLVYVGNTSKASFAEYIDACAKKGFVVDYSKGDDYYFADNKDGWSIDLRYEGNNVMKVYINGPSEEENKNTVTSSTESTEKDTNKKDLDANFKAAMDSYEEFMNEYVVFMKKYQKNPDDLGLLADYADYMSKYSDFAEKFSEWKNEDLTDEELDYYIEVQTRVNEKLLEVAE